MFIKCPFCEDYFLNLINLKKHLSVCEKFKNIDNNQKILKPEPTELCQNCKGTGKTYKGSPHNIIIDVCEICEGKGKV